MSYVSNCYSSIFFVYPIYIHYSTNFETKEPHVFSLQSVSLLKFFNSRGEGAGDPGPKGDKGDRGDKGEPAPMPVGPISKTQNTIY